MPDELKPEADFAADFRDGEAIARDWIDGRGDLPDSEAGAPRPVEAVPTPEARPSPPIDMDAFLRARREHARRERLNELASNNAATWRQDPLATFWRS